MRVRFLNGARSEFFDAEAWYEQAQEGLGSEFYREVISAISEIGEQPLRWPKDQYGTRRFFMSRFPYFIFYQMRESELLVVSIMHTSRQPGYWRRRVTKK